MEIWEATQNWLIFGVVAGGLAWYYYPAASSAVTVRSREQAEPIAAAPKRRNDRDTNFEMMRTKTSEFGERNRPKKEKKGVLSNIDIYTDHW